MMSQFDTDKFCQPPDPDLICCICQCVLQAPVESPCRHVFCKVCISTWLDQHRNCPTCRTRLITRHLRPVLPLVQNMINRLVMHCDFKDNGCVEKVMLELYLSHIENCGFKKVQCRFKSCGKMILKKEKDHHENETCEFREKLCIGRCGLMIPVCRYDNHDCYEELQRLSREKCELVDKLQETIKELNAQTLKLQKNIVRLKHLQQRRRDYLNSWDYYSSYDMSDDGSMYNYLPGSDSDSGYDLPDFTPPITSANSEHAGFPAINARPRLPIPPEPFSPNTLLSLYSRPRYETRSRRHVTVYDPNTGVVSSTDQALDLSHQSVNNINTVSAASHTAPPEVQPSSSPARNDTLDEGAINVDGGGNTMTDTDPETQTRWWRSSRSSHYSGLNEHRSSRSRSRSNDSIRSRSPSYHSYYRGRSRSRSYSYDSNWSYVRSRSRSPLYGRRSYNHDLYSNSRSRSRSRSFDSYRSGTRTPSSYRGSVSSSRSLVSRRRFWSRSRSRSVSSRSSSWFSRRRSRSPDYSRNWSRSRSRSVRGSSLDSLRSDPMTDGRPGRRSWSTDSAGSITPTNSYTRHSGTDDGNSARDHSPSGHSDSDNRTPTRSDVDHTVSDVNHDHQATDTESDSDADYNFKRRRRPSGHYENNASSSNSHEAHSLSHFSPEQRKRKICHGEDGGSDAKQVCNGAEDNPSDSDVSWRPSTNDVESDDDTITDCASSDSSYEVQVPKTVMEMIDDINSEESDETWSPNDNSDLE